MLVKYFAGKIVITLCLFFSTIIHAEHLDSELNLEQFLDDKGFVRIDYMKLPTHHALVEASINGKSGYFIIDTGAQATVSTTKVLKNLALCRKMKPPALKQREWEDRLQLALIR